MHAHGFAYRAGTGLAMAAIVIWLSAGNAFSIDTANERSLSSSISAPGGRKTPDEIVDKTHLLKTDFHPKLKQALNVEDESEIRFLKKISYEDQSRLADIIRQGIDSKQSTLLMHMANASNFFPAILLGKFAPMAGPELAARMSGYVSEKRSIAIARHTDPKFMAEMVYYLQPPKVVKLMEATPDDLLIKVGKIIIEKKDYYLMAEFADHLSVNKAKSLVYSLDDPEAMLHVGYYMKNIKLLGDTIAALPPDHMTGLIKKVIDLGYFEMSAKLSQRLEPDQIVMLLDKIDPAYVAAVAMNYPPELVLDVMMKMDDEHKRSIAEKLSQRLSTDQIAVLLNQANPDFVARFMALFPPEIVVETMGKMGDEYARKISLSLSHLLGAEQIIKLMDRFDPAYVAAIAIHFPPDVAKAIMDKLGNAQVDKLTSMVSQRMTSDQIVTLMEKVGPSDIANIVIHYPPELVLSVMEKLNESQIQMFMDKIGSQLNPEEISRLLALAKPEYVTRIIENYPPELVLQIIGKLGEDSAREIATRFSHEMSADQILQLMDKVDPAYLATIAIHFPPELAVRVMGKLNDAQVNEVAQKLGQRLTADQIVRLMEKSDPAYVVAIVIYCPPEVINAIMGKLDDAHIQLIAEMLSQRLNADQITKIMLQTRTQGALEARP